MFLLPAASEDLGDTSRDTYLGDRPLSSFVTEQETYDI